MASRCVQILLILFLYATSCLAQPPVASPKVSPMAAPVMPPSPTPVPAPAPTTHTPSPSPSPSPAPASPSPSPAKTPKISPSPTPSIASPPSPTTPSPAAPPASDNTPSSGAFGVSRFAIAGTALTGTFLVIALM